MSILDSYLTGMEILYHDLYFYNLYFYNIFYIHDLYHEYYIMIQ